MDGPYPLSLPSVRRLGDAARACSDAQSRDMSTAGYGELADQLYRAAVAAVTDLAADPRQVIPVRDLRAAITDDFWSSASARALLRAVDISVLEGVLNALVSLAGQLHRGTDADVIDVLTDTADRVDVSVEAWASLSRTPLFRTALAILDEQEH